MKNWYLNLPNQVRAAINSTWQSFVAVFGISLLGFLAKVQDWTGCDGPECHFPSVSPLGKALAGALVAGVTGLVTLVFRTIKPGPVYPSTTVEVVPPADVDKGDITFHILVCVVGIVCGVIVLLFGMSVITMPSITTVLIWAGVGIIAASVSGLV